MNFHSFYPSSHSNRFTETKLLPAEAASSKVIQFFRQHRLSIVVGPTGSGKTTCLPQYMLDSVLTNPSEKPSSTSASSIVVCTQPRRVAAIRMAQYVAARRGCVCGGEVGYAVRFDDSVSPTTRLKYVTDGILLRELLSDPMLSRVGAVILDEAHERTLHGDILLGLLKQLAKRRPSLRLVVMSATIDAEPFSKYLGTIDSPVENSGGRVPVGMLEGRQFPISLYYTHEPQADYVDAAVNTMIQLHLSQPAGDVLCFLTGRDDILQAKAVLDKRSALLPSNVAKMIALPLYASLTPEEQDRAFQPVEGHVRKIVLCTNIAETSLTVEGIVYVVDSGMVKARCYDPHTALETLAPVPVSRAQARQRTGRAGRLQAGVCYRLYPEQIFLDSLEESATPEILRCPLASTVLHMKALGIQDVLSFDFMDRPELSSLVHALEMLTVLGALDPQTQHITPLGKALAKLPLDPLPARALLAAVQSSIPQEGCAVVAMLSVAEGLFLQEPNNDTDSGNAETMSDKHPARSSLVDTTGDHLTFLRLLIQYSLTPRKDRAVFCRHAQLHQRLMERAYQIFKQLRALIFTRDELDSLPPLEQPSKAVHDALRRALCSGYFLHSAQFDPRHRCYRTFFNQQLLVQLHPTSILFQLRRKPPLVLYDSLLTTARCYMRHVVSVREEWLREASPLLFEGSQEI